MREGGGDAALRGGQAVQPQRPPRRPEAQLQQEADRRRQVRACRSARYLLTGELWLNSVRTEMCCILVVVDSRLQLLWKLASSNDGLVHGLKLSARLLNCALP